MHWFESDINYFDSNSLGDKYINCNVLPSIFPLVKEESNDDLSSVQYHKSCNSCPIVLDQENNIITESMEDIINWYPMKIWKYPKEHRKLIGKERSHSIQKLVDLSILSERKEVVIDKPVIWLASNFGFYKFGHLHDYLQKMFFIHERIKDMNNVMFLCSETHLINNFTDHLSALSHTNVNSDQIIVLNSNSKYKIRELYVGRSPAYPTNYTKESYDWVSSSYSNYFNKRSSKISLNRTKLYLSRNHVMKGVRQVLNEESLIPILKKNGFEILTGKEDLSIIHQKFSNASLIIGPHGSLFANSIYCPEDCVIVEFCPHNRMDRTFWAKLKACKTWHFNVSEADKNHNITISPDQLKDFLEG